MPMTTRSSHGVVYVAWVGPRLVKVGFTQNLDKRLRQLDQQGRSLLRDLGPEVDRGPADLIGAAPGSYIQEQHLVTSMRAHRSRPATHSREWFGPTVLDPLAAAWQRMFGVTLLVGAAS